MDVRKQSQQVKQLFSLVDSVVSKNGQPYEFSAELKKGASRLNDKKREVESLQRYTKQGMSVMMDQLYQQCDDQPKLITEVETRLKETTKRLEQQFAEKYAARLKAEEIAEAAQMSSNDEIRKLRESRKSPEGDSGFPAEGSKC